MCIRDRVLIIWVFLPDRGRWEAYRHNFDQELKALNEKYTVPDEENAAKIYDVLVQNYESGDFVPDLADSNTYTIARSQLWLSKDHPDLAQWLQGHERAVITLLKATKIEECKFQVDDKALKFFRGPSNRPHLPAMKSLSFLLICSANNDLAEKRNEHALEKQIAVLRMSEHLRQQPVTVDMLNGIACQVLVLRQINKFLVTANPTEPYLTKLDDIIAGIEHNWKIDWETIEHFEKLSVMQDLFWMLYETNNQGKIRVVVADFFQYFKPISLPDVPYWNTRRAKASSILAWFFLPQTPGQAAEIIEKTLHKYGKIEYLNSLWGRESPLRFNFSYIIDLYVDSFVSSVHNFSRRLKSDKRATRIIIALRRYKNEHGRWPEKLDDIRSIAPYEIFVDPVNNGKYVYKLTEQNFILYSRGRNNIDENSKGHFRNIEGEDDWLIWPRTSSSRKSKKEKANDEQQ